VTRRSNLIFRALLVAAGVAVTVVVVLSLGSDGYTLKLRMPNASGLRPGSQVLLGGVEVGTVKEINFSRVQNDVIARLKLDKTDVHVGQGARTAVVAANLLGEKYVSLTPGDAAHPLPSGTVLPMSATSLPTDLDQIVDVLDTGTRARLAMLLHDAGVAVSGRRDDVNAILRQFPLSLNSANNLLQTVVTDNHTLKDLVANSNGFIARLNERAPDLERAIDASASAASVFARRSDELREAVTVAAPGLRSFHDLFNQGHQVFDKVTPVLPYVADALPEVTRLLQAAGPFTSQAVPTLNRAAAAAPALSRLATDATPIVRQATPMVGALAKVARLSKNGAEWLRLSSEDIWNIFNGWTRAIQFRDGISHVFNGTLYLSPRVIVGTANTGASARERCLNLLGVKSNAVLETLGLTGQARTARAQGCGTPARTAKPKPGQHTPASPAPQATPTPAVSIPGLPEIKLPGVNLPKVKLPDLPGSAQPAGNSLGALLDYLLAP
jgi:virulence factor Mce-like protein